IDRYKNKEYIVEVYEKLEKCFWGRTKEEANQKYEEHTSKYVRNKKLPTLTRKQYNKLSEGAKKLCVPFLYLNERKQLRLRYYVNLPVGAYVIKYVRAYITHSKRINPLLKSEMALLSQHLLKSRY